MTELVNNRINYIEFSVTDMDASKAFYASAFDWEFTDYAPEYCGIRDETGECGGFAKVDSVSTGGPLVVLYSNALERSYERVTASGGEIVQEIMSFPGGRRFEFLDPSGNRLGVWSDN